MFGRVMPSRMNVKATSTSVWTRLGFSCIRRAM
jgi:hypothetical protein